VIDEEDHVAGLLWIAFVMVAVGAIALLVYKFG
jgi:hypothetical protein